MALAESHWLYFGICKMNAADLSILPKPPWSTHDVECKTAEPNHRGAYIISVIVLYYY